MPHRLGIATMSLGRCYTGHSLKHKLSTAAKHGIEGVELFYEDLVDHSGSDSPSDLFAGAASVRDLCSSLGLTIICLQPFMHYDGLLDRQKHAQRIQEIKLWMKLAKILQTDIIQVPATFLSSDQTSSDTKLIVSDLREIADLGLQQSPIIRIAYESLCWSTHVSTWELCWDIISQVDRSNFGICLDTFHILGSLYADPTSPTGKAPNGEKRLSDSIQRLVDEIKPLKEKIFFVQIADGERLGRPLISGHEFYNADQPALMSWSRNCRLFYGEKSHGGYMPVIDVAHAIINKIGYDGWVSMELFNRVMNRSDEAVVEELAERAAVSWRSLQEDLENFEDAQRGLLKSMSIQDRTVAEFTNPRRETNFSRL